MVHRETLPSTRWHILWPETDSVSWSWTYYAHFVLSRACAWPHIVPVGCTCNSKNCMIYFWWGWGDQRRPCTSIWSDILPQYYVLGAADCYISGGGDVWLTHDRLVYTGIIINLLVVSILFENFIFIWKSFIAVIILAWNPVGLDVLLYILGVSLEMAQYAQWMFLLYLMMNSAR